MALVDVVTEAVIPGQLAQVAAYAADPTNAPAWYANISTVEWKTSPPVGVGSRIAFVACFLGRRIAYTYEVTEYEPSTGWSCGPRRARFRWRRPTPGTR